MPTIYIPSVTTAPTAPPAPVYPCGMTKLEAVFCAQIQRAEWQQRPRLLCDARLCAAARDKANDQAANAWWLHTNPVTLETSNELCRRHGFPLPGDYEARGNQVESLGYGNVDPSVMLAAFLASAPHRAHLAGEGWFQTQDRIGIGYARGKDWPHLWVILCAKEGRAG